MYRTQGPVYTHQDEGVRASGIIVTQVRPVRCRRPGPASIVLAYPHFHRMSLAYAIHSLLLRFFCFRFRARGRGCNL